MTRTPAHHPKPDVPSERELRLAALAAAWRARRAAGFQAVDPRTPRQGARAARWYRLALRDARLWLDCLEARQREARRAAARAALRVILGGRR